MELEVKAYAKINLSLDVISEREDGYHEIDTIMQEISLRDIITIESGRGGFGLTSDDPTLPLDANNLVYRAWKLMKENYDGDPSVVIHIEKNIPMAAGLAGGSTDCAATMRGLNRFWNLGLTDEELMKIGVKLGADVPFFFQGGTCRAKGIGEELEVLKNFYGKHLLLINNGQQISSKFVYDNIKNYDVKIDMDAIATAINSDDEKIYSLMANKMEEVVFESFPELAEIKNDLIFRGAKQALMSGSGATIYGIFDNEDQMNEAYKQFIGKYPHVIKSTTR